MYQHKSTNQPLFTKKHMNTILLFMGIGTQEFLFLALIILLLFGGKKIPELMKGRRKKFQGRHERSGRQPERA